MACGSIWTPGSPLSRNFRCEGLRRAGFEPTWYGETVAVLIRIEDRSLVDDLCAHYRRSAFQAESVGGGMIEVTRRDASDDEQERREVLMHLRVWEVANPDARVELV